MSFSKTISVVAALASIFSVGLASWKISDDIKNSQTSPLEQKIQELEKEIEEAKKPVEQVAQPQVQTVQQPIILPPVAPPPPPAPAETQP